MIRVKNWERFQHYHDRRPLWIKLHRDLMDDFGFYRMSDAAQAMAPRIWILASEYTKGEIPYQMDMLVFRLHAEPKKLEKCLTELHAAGFVLIEDGREPEYDAGTPQTASSTTNQREEPDSTPLAECYQDASRPRADVYQAASPPLALEEKRTKPEQIQKKKPPLANRGALGEVCLPDWIPADIWADYVDMRNKIHKPMTAKAISLVIIELGKLRERGDDIRAVLGQSVLNSWQGVFPLRGGQDGKRKSDGADQRLRESAENLGY